jgi:hypothetical protein
MKSTNFGLRGGNLGSILGLFRTIRVTIRRINLGAYYIGWWKVIWRGRWIVQPASGTLCIGGFGNLQHWRRENRFNIRRY